VDATLDAVMQRLKDKRLQVKISWHPDNKGTAVWNAILSKHRRSSPCPIGNWYGRDMGVRSDERCKFGNDTLETGWRVCRPGAVPCQGHGVRVNARSLQGAVSKSIPSRGGQPRQRLDVPSLEVNTRC
jgi:hypothetical protein